MGRLANGEGNADEDGPSLRRLKPTGPTLALGIPLGIALGIALGGAASCCTLSSPSEDRGVAAAGLEPSLLQVYRHVPT